MPVISSTRPNVASFLFFFHPSIYTHGLLTMVLCGRISSIAFCLCVVCHFLFAVDLLLHCLSHLFRRLLWLLVPGTNVANDFAGNLQFYMSQ